MTSLYTSSTFWHGDMEQIFILRLVLLNLFVIKSLEAQKLEVNVLQPCPLNDNVGEIIKTSIKPHFHVGCTAILECRYRPECTLELCKCEFNNNTNLMIIPPSETILSSMIELNRSNCHVEVEIRNLTTDFSGKYICKDTTLPDGEKILEMFVGYPPESPSDVNLHFQPMNHTRIMFKVGRTGEELNDKDTKWKVCYNWSDANMAECLNLAPNNRKGRFRLHCTNRACTINDFIKFNSTLLNNAIRDAVVHPIVVNITAHNMFGTSDTVIHRLNVIDYIQPHLARHNALTVVNRGTTWLQLRVPLPKGIEPKVCKEMALRSNGRNQLKLKYSVHNVPERIQSQGFPDNIMFHSLHGFWRNLHSDEEASSRVSKDVALPFNKEFNWTDFNCSLALVNVSGLAPNICVNITMQAGGRYWGPEVMMNYSNTCTEDVLREGPKFATKPYFCFKENSCVTCAIYFMEIPRPFRGGRVNNYTLNGTRTSSAQTSNNECQNKWDFFVNASGQDNTIIVQSLEPEVTYNLSLQAFTTSGASPSSNYILPTSTSPVPSAPVKVDVEGGVNGGLYTVTWQAGDGENAEYFVHYCFALTNTLNCKTNMVTEKAGNSSMQKKSVEVPIIAKSIEGDTLVPIFFVSVATGDGQTNGLLKAECAHALDKGPGKIRALKVQPSDVENQFVVDFDTPCGQNYEYGRPEKYLIQVIESMKCPPSNTGQNAEYVFKEIVDADKEGRHIQRLFKVNKINTSYCLGVKTSRHYFELGQWEWTSFSTSDSMAGQNVHILIILIISACLVVLNFIFCLSVRACYSKYKSVSAKLDEKGKFKRNIQKKSIKCFSNDPLLPSKTLLLANCTIYQDSPQTSEDSGFHCNSNLQDPNNSNRDESPATSNALSKTYRTTSKREIETTSKADKSGLPHYCRAVRHVSDVTPTTEHPLSVSRNASSSHASQKCKTASCLQTLHTFTSTLSPENDLLLQEPEFSGFRLTPSRPFSAGTDTKKRLPGAAGQRSSCLQTYSQKNATGDVFRLLTPSRPLTSQPKAAVSSSVHWLMPSEVDAMTTPTDRNPASCRFVPSALDVVSAVENLPAHPSKNGQDADRVMSVDMTSSNLFCSLFPPMSSEFSDTAFTALTPSRPFSQQAGGGGSPSLLANIQILKPTRIDISLKDATDSSLNPASKDVGCLNFASSTDHYRSSVSREEGLCDEEIPSKQMYPDCLTPAMTTSCTMEDEIPRDRYSQMSINKDRYSQMSINKDRYSQMYSKDRYPLASSQSDRYKLVWLRHTAINLPEEACDTACKTESLPESTNIFARNFDHNLINTQRCDTTINDDKLHYTGQLGEMTVQMQRKDSDKMICPPNVLQLDDEGTRHSFDSIDENDS